MPSVPSTAVSSAASKPPRSRKLIVVPPILLEGDAPVAPAVSGPGERFALGPTAVDIPMALRVEIKGELPEAYGTQRLFLTARDPHWLYASWDFTSAQREEYNGRAKDAHMILRIFVNEPAGKPFSEIDVQPDSRSWFIHVGRGGTKFVAQLGFYNKEGGWVTVATSASTLTPPESMAQPAAVEFATIPPEISLKKIFEVVEQAVVDHVPLSEAVEQLRAEGWVDLPQIITGVPATPWTPAQAHALAEVIHVDTSRRVWVGSLEITELVRRHLKQEISSAALPAGPVQPSRQPHGGGPQPLGEMRVPLMGAAVSSPLGEEQGPAPQGRSFWFNVNAELVIYGATEPDAIVTVGRRQIRLRPDGSFSYRFALPDGEYPLLITAASADAADRRLARLEFSRSTEYQGEVAAHPQEADLKIPVEASVSQA